MLQLPPEQMLGHVDVLGNADKCAANVEANTWYPLYA